MAKEIISDLSDAHQKKLLWEYVSTLKGLHRISIVKYRERRSDAQRGYYFGVLVSIFGDWCREQGWEWTDDEAHKQLAKRFLSITEVHEKTGEIFESVQSTSDLDTLEFSVYQDQVTRFLTEFCGCYVPPPDPFYKRNREDDTIEGA